MTPIGNAFGDEVRPVLLLALHPPYSSLAKELLVDIRVDAAK